MLGDSLRRRHSGGALTPKGVKAPNVAKATKRPRLKPIRWRIVIPATLAAILIPFGVGYAVAVYVLFPPPEASGIGIAVPELIGRSVAEADQLLAAAGLGATDTIMLPHPDAPRGQVLAQDPLAGQQLRAGTDVRVSVSAGPPQITVPDVEGFAVDAAEQVLQRLGFETRRMEEESFTTPGRVLRIQPAPGSRERLPSTITIVVSTGYGMQDTTAVQPDTVIQ